MLWTQFKHRNSTIDRFKYLKVNGKTAYCIVRIDFFIMILENMEGQILRKAVLCFILIVSAQAQKR